MPIVRCRICLKKFYVRPSHLNRGSGKYCSLNCLYISMRNGKNVLCKICKKEIYRTPKELRHSKSHNFFCSKRHLAIWKNSRILIGETHRNWRGGENAYRKIIERAGVMPKCANC